MLSGLQEEIARYYELTGASPSLVMQRLNSDPASDGSTVVAEDPRKTPKGDLLALLSPSSIANIIKWMRAEADDLALVFHEFYVAHDTFKTSDPVFRNLISMLEVSALITTEELAAILACGERPRTRSEELWGRAITEEDFV